MEGNNLEPKFQSVKAVVTGQDNAHFLTHNIFTDIKDGENRSCISLLIYGRLMIISLFTSIFHIHF